MECRRKDKHSPIHIPPVNIDRDGSVVGLDVYNASGYDIIDPLATCDGLTRINHDGTIKEIPIAPRDNVFSHAEWVASKVIRYRRHSLCPIAEARDGEIAFLIGTDTETKYTFPYIVNNDVRDTSPEIIVEKGSPLLDVPVGTGEYDIRLSFSGYFETKPETKHFEMRCVGHIHFQ